MDFSKSTRGAAFVWFLAQKSQGIDFYNHWCSRVCTQRKQQRAAKSFCCVQTWVSSILKFDKDLFNFCTQKLQALSMIEVPREMMESQSSGPGLEPDSINSMRGFMANESTRARRTRCNLQLKQRVWFCVAERNLIEHSCDWWCNRASFVNSVNINDASGS